jgi:hypothetical protein
MISGGVVLSSGLQTPAAGEGFDLKAWVAQHGMGGQGSQLTSGTILATLT